MHADPCTMRQPSTSSRSGPSHPPSPAPEPGSSPAKRKQRNKKDRASGKANPSPYTSGYEDVGSTSTPPPPAAADFSKDFDFQGGLQAFDKARVSPRSTSLQRSARAHLRRLQVWAEIQRSDATDPSTRLVAHNRKPQDEGMRKLANDEMVLSSEEQLVNGITATTLDPVPSPRPRISAHQGPAIPMSFAQLTEALHTASAETGPNLVQRVESAGRSISTYALTILSSQARTQPAVVAVLASCGVKGSYALRAAACLANRGVKVVALIVSQGKPPHAFDFYIRLVMASGGDVVSKLPGPCSPSLSKPRI